MNTCRTCRHFDGENHPWGKSHGRCRWLDWAVPDRVKLPHWIRLESLEPTVSRDQKLCGAWEGKA